MLLLHINPSGRHPDAIQDPADAEGAVLPICALPNFVEEADMLAWAGVGFGRSNTLLIMNSLRHLGAGTEGLKKVRFWGLVMAKEADYYIAEAQTEAPGETDADNPLFEALGSGANTFAYWVLVMCFLTR